MRHFKALLILPLLLAATFAFALSDFSLSDEEAERLSEEARVEYDKAREAVDVINYREALEHLKNAAAEDVDHKELQFLTAKLAVYEGRKEFGEEAVADYEIAVTALERVLALEQKRMLREPEKRRAEHKLDNAKKLIAEQAERDVRRKQLGLKIVKAQEEDYDRLAKTQEKRQETSQEEVVEALQRTMGAGGMVGGSVGSPY